MLIESQTLITKQKYGERGGDGHRPDGQKSREHQEPRI
jgi:hypothetical protein